MVVEVDSDHAVHWMSPMDADEALILSLGRSGKLPHRAGFQAACVDGSVRYLEGGTKPATLRAMISIAAGDGTSE